MSILSDTLRKRRNTILFVTYTPTVLVEKSVVFNERIILQRKRTL